MALSSFNSFADNPAKHSSNNSFNALSFGDSLLLTYPPGSMKLKPPDRFSANNKR